MSGTSKDHWVQIDLQVSNQQGPTCLSVSHVPPNKTPKRLRCQSKEHFFKSEGLTSAKRLKR